MLLAHAAFQRIFILYIIICEPTQINLLQSVHIYIIYYEYIEPELAMYISSIDFLKSQLHFNKMGSTYRY